MPITTLCALQESASDGDDHGTDTESDGAGGANRSGGSYNRSASRKRGGDKSASDRSSHGGDSPRKGAHGGSQHAKYSLTGGASQDSDVTELGGRAARDVLVSASSLQQSPTGFDEPLPGSDVSGSGPADSTVYSLPDDSLVYSISSADSAAPSSPSCTSAPSGTEVYNMASMENTVLNRTNLDSAESASSSVCDTLGVRPGFGDGTRDTTCKPTVTSTFDMARKHLSKQNCSNLNQGFDDTETKCKPEINPDSSRSCDDVIASFEAQQKSGIKQENREVKPFMFEQKHASSDIKVLPTRESAWEPRPLLPHQTASVSSRLPSRETAREPRPLPRCESAIETSQLSPRDAYKHQAQHIEQDWRSGLTVPGDYAPFSSSQPTLAADHATFNTALKSLPPPPLTSVPALKPASPPAVFDHQTITGERKRDALAPPSGYIPLLQTVPALMHHEMKQRIAASASLSPPSHLDTTAVKTSAFRAVKSHASGNSAPFPGSGLARHPGSGLAPHPGSGLAPHPGSGLPPPPALIPSAARDLASSPSRSQRARDVDARRYDASRHDDAVLDLSTPRRLDSKPLDTTSVVSSNQYSKAPEYGRINNNTANHVREREAVKVARAEPRDLKDKSTVEDKTRLGAPEVSWAQQMQAMTAAAYGGHMMPLSAGFPPVMPPYGSYPLAPGYPLMPPSM